MKIFFTKILNWIKNLLFDENLSYVNDNNKMLRMNPLCPSCRSTMGYFQNGLVEIEYDYTAGGPIGAGVHISGHACKEYQFHYYKCPKGCKEGWEMYEYRETPSWWDDLWNIDCPFTRGDIIKKYQNGEFYNKKYTGHRITR